MEENQLKGRPDRDYESMIPPVDLDTILKGDWSKRRRTTSFEEAQTSLSDLQALRQWRSDAQRYGLVPFYNLLETATAVRGTPGSDAYRQAAINDLVERLIPAAQSLSHRLADMYFAFCAELDGSPYTPQFEMTSEQLSRLKESGDLATLLDPGVTWEIKQNRMETRILGDLRGRRALDRPGTVQKESEKVLEDHYNYPSSPLARDEAKPGMDEMKEEEGKVPRAIWEIHPPYGGYYAQQRFDRWDATNNSWKATYDFRDMANLEVQPDFGLPGRPTKLEMQCYVYGALINRAPGEIVRKNAETNDKIRIPMPEGYDIFSRENYMPKYIRVDQFGDYIMILSDGGGFRPALKLNQSSYSRRENTEGPVVLIPCNLTSETSLKLTDVNTTKKGNLKKARALASYTMRRLTYSNDSSYNSIYDTHPKGYIGGIDELGKADCDVANTYLAALCSQLNIPVRFVVGHMVRGILKGKTTTGRKIREHGRITSGTGHAWCEVWDEIESKWVRVDATPPGDPNMDEKQEKGEHIPGDYGGQEALGPTDEELANLEAELSKLTERLSYTPAERELSKATGGDLKEARLIIQEIQRAEGTRLSNGELVTDVLSQLFSQIIEARKTSSPDYAGPVRRKEGGEEIENIVAHVIGVRHGESDPISRQISSERIHQAAAFGGFDVYFVGDKSGSMSDTVNNEEKWKMQRQAQYLILSSLHRFSENLLRLETIMTDPLHVRTQAISFRDSVHIDVDKPLSPHFTSVNKVTLWKSLGNQGSGNGDITALTQIYKQIETEVAEIEKQGKKDNRLRIIIACSDGYPDDVKKVHQLAEDLGKLNAVVVGVGLTETAANVPIIFDTPYSRGDIARDIHDLPAIVAKHVIMEAIRLFPDKARESVERYIQSILSKLNVI